jgi:hypothetical protein
MLTFTIYGSRHLVLESESTKILVSADGVGTLHGIMRVSREKMRRMSKYDARRQVVDAVRHVCSPAPRCHRWGWTGATG